MPEYKAPLRDMQFAMQEVLDFSNHYAALPGCEDASPDMVGAILEEAARFAENVIAPLNKVGDEEGVQWHDGAVTTPSGFKEAYDRFVEGGWIGLPHPPEHGGQGLPPSLASVVSEMLASANHSWMMYPMLTGTSLHCHHMTHIHNYIHRLRMTQRIVTLKKPLLLLVIFLFDQYFSSVYYFVE